MPVPKQYITTITTYTTITTNTIITTIPTIPTITTITTITTIPTITLFFAILCYSLLYLAILRNIPLPRGIGL